MVYMLQPFKRTSTSKVPDTMTTLNTNTLAQFGFMEDNIKSNKLIKVFSRDKFEIVLKDNAFYYSNLGIDYPLYDLNSLKKLYKENRRTELKMVS